MDEEHWGDLMSHGIRNIIVVLFIIVITVVIATGLHRYLSVSIREAAIAGAIGFCILIVLHNNLNLQRHFRRVDRYFRDVNQFEQDIAGRIKLLEYKMNGAKRDAGAADATMAETREEFSKNEIPPPQFGNAPGLLSEMAGSRSDHSRNPVSPAHENQGGYRHTPDNIIALNSRMERVEKPAARNALRIKSSQLARALEKGGAEVFLQPVLELPSRNVRYFEAFVRLRIGDNILTEKQFLPAARDSGQIARIDLLSLELTFKVVRGLQRQDNEYPVFWNITRQSLGDQEIFSEILEQLRANQPLNRHLICEISHSAYTKLNTLQSDNLARILDLGYELSLDNVTPRPSDSGSIDRIIESGMFGIIKIPAKELMRIGGGDIANFADHIVPLAMNKNIVLIASQVESDAQTVSMIDADVYLVQGDALMPAKALKKELGGL